MIDPRIRYVNEPGLGAYILSYFKANFLAMFLHEAGFNDGKKRKYACFEARFICITDSRIYEGCDGGSR